MSTRFAECADPTFLPRMGTVVATVWTCVVCASLLEVLIMGETLTWVLPVWAAAVGLVAGVIGSIVYWLADPYGHYVMAGAVTIAVFVTACFGWMPMMLAYLPFISAPVAAVLTFAALCIPPVRRYLKFGPR